VSGLSYLNGIKVNDITSLLSSLNVSGFTILNNKTSLLSSLNVSGFTTLNNTASLLSSLNVRLNNIKVNIGMKIRNQSLSQESNIERKT
jgi:hypothetical protein